MSKTVNIARNLVMIDFSEDYEIGAGHRLCWLSRLPSNFVISL